MQAETAKGFVATFYSVLLTGLAGGRALALCMSRIKFPGGLTHHPHETDAGVHL